MLLEIDTGVKEARLLHPGQFGYFALFRKPPGGRGRPRQRMYQMAQLDAVVSAMQRQPDAYLSQASFVTTSRRETFLHEIRSVFVDLDCYNLGLEPDASFLARVIDQAELVGIPAPSYVVRSGRGLYAKWLFTVPLGASHLPRWKALQASILSVYRKLGADLKVRDSSRVLRIIGSTNSKSAGSEVEAIFNSGEMFDFEELCNRVASVDLERHGLVDERSLERTLSRIKRAVHEGVDVSAEAAIEHLTFYAQSREPILLARHTAQGLNWRRFLDLRDLAKRRGGIHEGSRDMFMFWMMSFLAHSEIVTEENFFDEARELSRAMSSRGFDPLNDGSLQTLAHKVAQRRAGVKVEFRGLKYDPVYTPSNDYLIDVLGITDEEMRSLRTIISSHEKLRRSDAKAEGRSQRREARIQWRVQAMTLLSSGTMSQAEIAAKVGVSRAQVSRLAAGKLKTPGTVAAVLEKAGRASQLEQLRARTAADHKGLRAAHPADPAQPGAHAHVGVPAEASAGAQTPAVADEAAAYEEILRLSRATRAEHEAERERRRIEAEQEREALRRRAMDTAQRLLQHVKQRAAEGCDAGGQAVCGPQKCTTMSDASAERAQEMRPQVMPPQALGHQESTMADPATKKTSAGAKSRELLMKAKQAKAQQGTAAAPAEQAPPLEAAHPQSQRVEPSSESATLQAPPGPAAMGASEEGAHQVEPGAKTSPFAQLVARQAQDKVPTAAHRSEAVSAQSSQDEGAIDDDFIPVDPDAGTVVPGSKLTFSDLARRGAERKAQLAQAEQVLKARTSGASDLPPDPPWDQPNLPAGSRYTEQEWEEAREGGRYHVFELHVAKEAALVQMEKAPAQVRRKQVVDGKLVEVANGPFPQGFIDAVTAELLDGCLLIGPKGQTQYPRAAAGRLIYRHPELGDWEYRIIRPASQAESHAYLATVRATYWPMPTEEAEAETARPRCR